MRPPPPHIGGGNLNGRRLQSVPGLAVRPTSGRVRQALFNMLRGVIGDAIFLDLFAGTGSVGLEALSHGAQQVYFVEEDRQTASVLRANVEHCGLSDRAILVSAALPQGLQHLPATLQADVIFLDPPYASDLAERTLAELADRPLLGPHGMVVWQHAAKHEVPDDVLGRPCWKRRRYGDTRLSVFRA